MSVKPRVIIIDAMHKSIVPLLEAAGYEPDHQPNIKRDEIIKILPQYDGMIVRSKTVIDTELLGHSTLKFIARAGAGIDQLDVDEIEKRGIRIVNAPEGNRDALGEHALGLLLNVVNNINKSDHEVRQGIWDREGNRGYEVKGKTVGIIGYGYMGSAFAEKLSGLSCKVMAYDKYKQNFSDQYVEEVTMSTLYQEADILSLHVPLTDETRFMVNKSFLGSFKKKLIFLNTSRGEVVSLKDTLDMIKSGKIRCAGFDVLENEKLDHLTSEQDVIYQELFQLNNVVFTPHIGGWTEESYQRINENLIGKIKSLQMI